MIAFYPNTLGKKTDRRSRARIMSSSRNGSVFVILDVRRPRFNATQTLVIFGANPGVCAQELFAESRPP